MRAIGRAAPAGLLVATVLGAVVIAGGGVTLRAPRRGRELHTGDLTRGLDHCRVWRAAQIVGHGKRRRRLSRRLIVSVPLTQVGTVHLDEEEKARALFVVLLLAGEAAKKQRLEGYPTHAQLIEFIASRRGASPRELLGRAIVPLASAGGTPPRGVIGYYSDGAEHVAAVTLSGSGRRLFIEYELDGVLRTNVAGFIFGPQGP